MKGAAEVNGTKIMVFFKNKSSHILQPPSLSFSLSHQTVTIRMKDKCVLGLFENKWLQLIMVGVDCYLITLIPAKPEQGAAGGRALARLVMRENERKARS